MSASDDSELDSELDDFEDLAEDSVKQWKNSREVIKERVDQYLTATRLGRMAFIAGDIQLAKDRFNRAMSLEMQTEFENNGDFGVTSSLLREEMVTRCNSPTDGGTTATSPSSTPHCVYDRLGNMLCRLSQIFEHADSMLGKRPDNPKWYLVMASALCMINEWGKAEIVYKEGLKACPDDKGLHQSLRSLHKVMDSINELTKKAGHNTSSTGSDYENSQYLAMNIISTMTTPATSSTMGNRRPVNKVVRRKFGSLPSSDSLKVSATAPMSKKIVYGSQTLTPPLSPRSRSQSLIPSNKTKHYHMAKRFSVQQLNQQSLWQSLFSPTLQAQLLGKSFSSKTLETMRTINKLAIVELSALQQDSEGDPNQHDEYT